MRRQHLIEIHEQPWCPAAVRHGVRGLLERLAVVLPAYEAGGDELFAALEATGSARVVDLCAGAGGPWLRLLAEKPEAAARLEEILLTDIFPDPEALARIEALTRGRIRGLREPVDALDPPASLTGFRTLFESFHHFEPARAEQILRGATEAGEGVGIFELTERKLLAILFIALATVPLALALMPTVRPFRPAYLLWTYLLPVIPLVLALDGVVSCLRSYTPEELEALGRRAAPHYRWRAGRRRAPLSPLWVVYLVGIPPEARDQI